jgi:hypothetical protein
MEIEDKNKRAKLRRARRKVAELKGFYVHLMIYLIVNTMISVIKIVGNSYHNDTFTGPFWQVGTWAPWLFWGIGLAFHAMKVFGLNPFFGKDWEERRIKEFMNEQENENRWN